MEPKFKVGDVVQLKSGGVNMTIQGFKRRESETEQPDPNKPEKNFYHCCWFENGVFRETDKYVAKGKYVAQMSKPDLFPEEILVIADSNKKKWFQW